MEKFKVSPGPWKFDKQFNQIQSSEGLTLILSFGRYAKEEDKHLIASAPELLEALLLMVDIFHNSNIEQQEAKLLAIAAINKALNIKP